LRFTLASPHELGAASSWGAMTPTTVFISPHLDDAILSCAGRIQRHVARGERVVLLTIFSHADPEDAAGWAGRRREDAAAATLLGAEPRWLGMPDAPFRDPAYAGFDFDVLTGPHAPGDARWRERLTERLREELEALCPGMVYAPLGVGDHVDHRLVFEAAAELRPSARFYEDHPYALVAHAVRRRLDALGLVTGDPTPPPAPAAYLAALAAAPYIARYLPPGPARARCFARLRDWPTPPRHRLVPVELERLDPASADLAERAIWTYASQAPDLFGTRERYRALVRAHAERLGTAAPRAERYYLDVPRAPRQPPR
jgi:LmbE family N-acetylglucosaminyl deacetylase